jgi:nucleoside-diphosphate-sugar epimerase
MTTMRILVLGATGLIGSAVLRALVAEGHRCTALVRHPGRVAALPPSVEPICGDIRHPAWLAALAPHDAVIHAAASFDDDMATADLALTTALIDWGTRQAAPPHLILTGGCWLYPARHEPPLVEGDAFAPLPAFRWMLDHRARLEAAGCVRVTMVHPAIVWTEAAGPPAEMAATLTRGEAVTVVGDPATRWPLVHADDLAQLYVRAVAHGGPCDDLHGVTEPGVAVGDIVATLACHLGLPPLVQTVAVADAVARHGDWIAGQARSQVMLAPRSRALLGWRGVRRIADTIGA